VSQAALGVGADGVLTSCSVFGRRQQAGLGSYRFDSRVLFDPKAASMHLIEWVKQSDLNLPSDIPQVFEKNSDI